MTPISGLEAWPPEIFEATTRQLPLADLCNLRLVSKAIAALVAQDRFKQYYRIKPIVLSPESLAEFVRMTQAGLLGVTELEHLILTGIAVDTKHLTQIVEEKARWETESNGPMFCSTQHKLSEDELAKAKEDLDGLHRRKAELEEFHVSDSASQLLAEAFSNIAAYGKHGKLPSLTLEVALLEEDPTKKLLPIQTRSHSCVWQAGEAAFRAAMRALNSSGMPVEKLDVLTGQWHCSLGQSALAYVHNLKSQGLQKALGGLQSLSMSLSADAEAATDTGDKSQGNDQEGKQNPKSAVISPEITAEFFTVCPQLRHLHLHWFLLRSADRDEHFAEKLLKQAVKKNALTNVQSLTLRGLHFEKPTLLDVLKAAPIRDLRLENIYISDPAPLPADHDEESDPEDPNRGLNRPVFEPATSRTWDAIFTYCTSPKTNMSSLVFDDLWGKRLLHFMNVPGGRSKMPWTPYTAGVETLERKGREEVGKAIQYAYAKGRPLGSPQAYNWRVLRGREYGPA